MAAGVEVARVQVERTVLTAEQVPELRELFGLERLPLGETKVEIELRGVPTAVVNALRRVVTDEMPGRALQVPEGGFDTEQTTDGFMLPQFVNDRIALVPLRTQIPAEVAESLRLRLDVTNAGASALTVYTGDLEVAEGEMPEPLFDPIYPLALIQPGKRVVVRGIHIATGRGRDHAAFHVACRAAYRHLDIPQYGVEDTHAEGGAAVDSSGYKISSLVADPRHHVLTATLFATSANPADVRMVFIDACKNIKDRLRFIVTAVERSADAQMSAAHSRGVQYTVVRLENGLTEGILLIPGETHTIGELLRRVVFDLTPDISNVTYRIVPHDNLLSFHLRHSEDVTQVLLDAARRGITIFDEIHQGIAAAH